MDTTETKNRIKVIELLVKLSNRDLIDIAEQIGVVNRIHPGPNEIMIVIGEEVLYLPNSSHGIRSFVKGMILSAFYYDPSIIANVEEKIHDTR